MNKLTHTPIDTMPYQPKRTVVEHPYVIRDPDILGGSPHIQGTRVPVRRLWTWHKGGATVETLMKRYPNLGPARVLAALAFAFDNQELIEADLALEASLAVVR